MNILAYLGIIISFAIGYVTGVLTNKLLKIAFSLLALAAIIVGLYYYYLR